MGIMKRQAEAMTNRRSWGQKSNPLGGRTWPIEVIVEGDTGITQRHQRELDKKSVAKFNRQVRAWGKMVNGALVTSIGQHIDKDVHLSSSLKQNYRHYGKTLEKMIQKATEVEPGVEKEVLVKLLATQMKKSFLNWNKESVEDTKIFKDLEELSEGQIVLNEETHKLMESRAILSRNNNNNNNNKKNFTRKGR